MKTGRRPAMAKPVFQDLPRFDTPPEPGRLADLLRATASGEPTIYPNGDPIADDGAGSEQEDVAGDEQHVEAEAATDTALLEEDFKTLIGQLNTAIAEVQNDIDGQVARATHALAMRLFPKLSETFLADEVAAQLPGLIPTPVARIEVQADESVVYKLNELLAETELSERCEIVVDPSPSDTRIRVSWGSGGVVFDFDGLLQACLAKLQDDREHTGALGHV